MKVIEKFLAHCEQAHIKYPTVDQYMNWLSDNNIPQTRRFIYQFFRYGQNTKHYTMPEDVMRKARKYHERD